MKFTKVAALLVLSTTALTSPINVGKSDVAVVGDSIVVHAELSGKDYEIVAIDDSPQKREAMSELEEEEEEEVPLEKRQTTAFVNQMLAYHNAYRAHHGATAMSWSTTLATFAQNSAKACNFAHTANDPYGENIAAGTYTNPAYYVYLWYNEVAQYNFNAPGFSSATGHFTQVVWNASTQLGCAWVTGCKGSYPNFLFCEYNPRGNVLPASNFATNVGKPKTSPANPAVPATNA